MAMSYMNVGRDMSSVMLIQDGYIVPDLLVSGFSSGHGEDGIWHGTITIDRNSGELERLIYKDRVFTIMATVLEVGGAMTKYVYPNAVLRVAHAGTWSPDAVVSQTIAFTSEARHII
jgi:hypothetical protein